MPPKEDKGAEPSPMKGSGSRSRIDPLTLAMEVANAREKGGKVSSRLNRIWKSLKDI